MTKRYRVNPITSSKNVMEESSKISVIEGATPGVRPESVEAPQNTSFIGIADESVSDLELQRSVDQQGDLGEAS